jgi:hypothetical protein
MGGTLEVPPVLRTTRNLVLVAVTVVGGLTGCQRSTTPEPSARPTVIVNGSAATPEGQASSTPQVPIERALKSDPCAARLHDIGGAMLQYYALNNRLPATLEELQPLADLGRPLVFKCPASGEAYTYVPAGLRSAGDDDGRQIVLHDAKGHGGENGTRWTIMMQRPRGRQAAATWVVPLTAGAFRAYAAPPAGASPAGAGQERRGQR